MSPGYILIFQERGGCDLTILPKGLIEGFGRFGDVVIVNEQDFRIQGLDLIRKLLDTLYDTNLVSQWSWDNRFLWSMFYRKPRTIALRPSRPLPEALIEVWHYDNSKGCDTPCHFEDDSSVRLDISEGDFAAAVFGGLERSLDWIMLDHHLWNVKSLFCVIRDDRTGLHHWFDWVKVHRPGGYNHMVTAWGLPRVFDREAFRRQCRRLAIQSLREYPGRREQENPNPTPRGSQVTDSGVAEQRYVVVFQRDDSDEAFIRVYNFDNLDREQTPSGFDLRLALDSPEDAFDKAFCEALDRCDVEW